MAKNIVEHKATFLRWAAAIYGDYEIVVTKFVSHKNWDFETFKAMAAESHTALLHHSSVGKGICMEKQCETASMILMQVARNFWLDFPLNEFRDNLFNDDYFLRPEPSHRIKSMLAGFYLTYFMFKSQTVRKLAKIQLNAQDLTAFHYFKLCIAESTEISKPIKISLSFLLNDLVLDEAFQLVWESKQHGIEPSIRNYNNTLETTLVTQSIIEKESKLMLSSAGRLDVFNDLVKFEAEKLKTLKDSYRGLFGRFRQAPSKGQTKAPPGPECATSEVDTKAPRNLALVQPQPDCFIPQPWIWSSLATLTKIRLMLDRPKLLIHNLVGDDREEGRMIAAALQILKRNKANKGQEQNKLSKLSGTTTIIGFNINSYLCLQNQPSAQNGS